MNNIGNTNIIDVNVTDLTFGKKIPFYNSTGSPITPDTILAPDDQFIGNDTYITSQADVNNGSVSNTAIVNGTVPDHFEVSGIVGCYENNGLIGNQKTYILYAIQTPALTIAKLASPTKYTTAGDIITYTYTVTNTGNVDILGDITVTDDHISSPVTISNSDLPPGHSVTGTATYTITQSDIDAGSVTNSAYATNNNIKSKTDTAKVTYEKPTNEEKPTHEEDNNGEPWNGGPGYGGALVPMPMYGSSMYGSEPYGTTEVPNSESCKAKVSLSKHNHKNHSKHHKAEKNHSKHHKAEKNHSKHHKAGKNHSKKHKAEKNC